MGSFARDDVVELGSAQVTVLDVLAAPAVPGTSYGVTLPINDGDDRTFGYVSVGGESVADVALELVGALVDGQTKYSIAPGPLPRQVTIVGPVGEDFDPVVTANVAQTVVQRAVLAVSQRTGKRINRVILTAAAGSFPDGQSREGATRRVPGGPVRTLNVLRGRELDTGNVFDFDARLVRSRVRPAVPIPFTPGEDGGQAIEGRGGWSAAYACDDLVSPSTWPALRGYGGTPMDLPATAGLALYGRSTEDVLGTGIGDSRVDRAVLVATQDARFAQEFPSNLPDVSGAAVHHQRLIFKAPRFSPGAFVVAQVAGGAQSLSLSTTTSPLGPTWTLDAVDSLGPYTSGAIPILPGLVGRWWIVDVQLEFGNPGQLHLYVNGIDLTGAIPPSGGSVPEFGPAPAVSLLDLVTPGPATAAIGALVSFVGLAWRDSVLTVDEHREDANACGLR